MIKYLITFLLTFNTLFSFAQLYTIKGTIQDRKTKEPVEFASVVLEPSGLWAISDKNGAFAIRQVPVGKMSITVSYIGYAKYKLDINVSQDVEKFNILLSEDNLALNEVTVTAQRKESEATTTYTIDRNAIDHLQVLDVAQLTSLLPGGQTSRSNTLLGGETFYLRSGNPSEGGYASEKGYSAMGTAVEVDGVRLSNNASMSGSSGVDTRNISSSNIQSVEIITGVPSVEYGDLTNGVVKINTIRGKSPLTVEFLAQPNTKQYTLGKGFLLSPKAGTLNIHLEHTKSVSDIASPYTAYKRNVGSLAYNNVVRVGETSIILKAGLTGNIGGYDSKSDPDKLVNTYLKQSDNVLRGNIEANWQLNKPWITSVEASSSLNYSDKHTKSGGKLDAASSTAAFHSMEDGYYLGEVGNPYADVVLIPAGNWYEVSHNESRVLSYIGKLKATWSKKIDRVSNRLMVGSELNHNANHGRGTYYEDLATAPTWREYRYKDLPAQKNISIYAEDRVSIPINKTHLQLTLGLRSDITSISGSEYGTVSSVAPRLNMRYNIPFKRNHFLKNILIRSGWGEAVRLPSFDVLYPAPTYKDNLIFAPGALSDGTVYYAYNTSVSKPMFNSDLKWQKNSSYEIGVDVNTKWANISLSFYNNKTINPYTKRNLFSPYSYNFTPNVGENFPIAYPDRAYSIDQNGVVTVSDKTGVQASQQLDYITRNTVKTNSTWSNGSSIVRRGLEWVIDFAKIPVLRTSFRVDGKYYYYKGVDETLLAARPATIDENSPYKYIGYYAGSESSSNGNKVKRLNTNFTVTTHIPEVKLIVSLRLEATFYNYQQALSDYKGNTRAFVIDSKADNFPSATHHDIYAGDHYVATYPLYYVDVNDMDTKIPFTEEMLRNAQANDMSLYNDLSRMIIKTGNTYTFKGNRTSMYYSANLSVTKEIGKWASISFNAKNFFNNLKTVKSTWNDTNISLYENSQLIPSFYYGLSLRVKI